MKHSIKGLFVILAIIMSLVVVQSICATELFTVTGEIISISTRPNMIVVKDDLTGDDTEVYGVGFKKLENHNIFLEEGVTVSIDVSEYTCLSGTVKLMAYSITVGDVTIKLR